MASNPSRLQNTFDLNIQVEKLFLIHSRLSDLLTSGELEFQACVYGQIKKLFF